MFTLKVRAEFEAAHRIADYPGKCDRLHGHNWTVEAVIAGRELDELGMLIDFKEAKNNLNEVLATFDHQYLNDLPMFAGKMNPTAENLARYVFDELSRCAIFAGTAKLASVCVWERPNSCVSYSPDDGAI